MPRKGVQKRVARLKASGMSGKEAKQTARKRAAAYSKRTSSQRSNRSGSDISGTSQAIGRGKQGSLKRKLWKAGGTKSELRALRAQTKSTRKHIKRSARASNYDLRGTAQGMMRTRNYANAVTKAMRDS